MSNPYSEQLAREDPSASRSKHRTPVSKGQRILGYFLMLVGAITFAVGIYLEMRNPRSNAGDNLAWMILAAATAIGSAGLSLRFLPPILAPFAALAGPPIGFGVAVVFFWVYVFIRAVFTNT